MDSVQCSLEFMNYEPMNKIINIGYHLLCISTLAIIQSVFRISEAMCNIKKILHFLLNIFITYFAKYFF